MGDRPGRGGRQNRVELAHSLRRPWNRVGESHETAILNGRQPVGTMGIELARRAEARGFGWCRLLIDHGNRRSHAGESYGDLER